MDAGLRDPDFLRRLEALRLAVRRKAAGAREGDRPSGRPGGAASHHSHRSYVQGDDFRAIDWNAYVRLGELFVRERERERAVRLHVAVDASASMAAGGKRSFALRLAAALGAVAEAEGGEAVLCCGFQAPLTIENLERLPGGPSASASVAALRPGSFCVALTDPWDEPALSPPGALIDILAPEEVDPPFRGRLRLVDSETGDVVDRTVEEADLVEYRRRLAERCGRRREEAHRREVGYVRCRSDDRMEDVIRLFVREGVLE